MKKRGRKILAAVLSLALFVQLFPLSILAEQIPAAPLAQPAEPEHEKARTILRENRAKLDEIARYLYEKETISGEEFMRILTAVPQLQAASCEAGGAKA